MLHGRLSSMLGARLIPRLRNTISVRDDRPPSKRAARSALPKQRRSERGLLGRWTGACYPIYSLLREDGNLSGKFFRRPCRNGKRLRRQLSGRDPRDARRQLAIALDEFLDCLKGRLERNEQSERVRIAMQAVHKSPKTAEIAPGDITVLALNPAVPLVILQRDAMIGTSGHVQMDIDGFALRQSFGSVKALYIQA